MFVFLKQHMSCSISSCASSKADTLVISMLGNELLANKRTLEPKKGLPHSLEHDIPFLAQAALFVISKMYRIAPRLIFVFCLVL